MPKTIDGVSPMPERRKSIRNIPIPESRRRAERAVDGLKKAPPIRAALEAELESPASPSLPPRPINTRGPSRKGFWFSLIAALALIAFGVLSLFSGATLAYVPRSAPLAFTGETFSTFKSSGTGLLYSVVKLSGDKGVSVAASGEQDVSRKASGTIIVYNNASADAQTFVATTRFQTTDGKVYRTPKGITVPGKKGDTPGSVEVQVIADQPGVDYNIDLTDFTLPGLKGTARAETIYARSKTAMSGGFVGKEKGTSPDDLTKAKASLQTTLSEELIAKAQAEVPADFILFPALTSVTFEDLPQSQASGSTVTVNLRGSLLGIMFKKSDLALALSLGKAARGAKDPVEVADYSTLQVAFAGSEVNDLLNATKIDFKVTGNALLVWKTDEVALKSDLAGRKKSELAQILKNYPTVASATASLRPFWKSTFPSEATQIILKKTNP